MKTTFLTVDLGFGDAGKGSIVDFLARSYQAHTVVRYNGGAQAGHRVVTGGDLVKEHVFSQFGSGTLAGAGTHLSRFMLVDPFAMLEEEAHLRTLGVTNAFDLTTIDEEALIVTPFQRAVNRLRELARGKARHGSCGMGIGETMADSLHYPTDVVRAGDLNRPNLLYKKLQIIREINLTKLASFAQQLPQDEHAAQEAEMLRDEEWLDITMQVYAEFAEQANLVASTYLHEILHRAGTVIFEAAQGVLLDEWYGFHPHTTWSTTTLANANLLLQEADYDGAVTRIGITRAYATRHGSGPFVSEDHALTQALPDACNGFDEWQHGFRVGWLDLIMLRYAIDVVGQLDTLAVTCLDRLANLSQLYYCNRYRHNTSLLDHIAKSPIPHDLTYQAQLTHKLKQCQPILQPIANTEALLHVIEEELGLPIGLLSAGPTAQEKELCPL